MWLTERCSSAEGEPPATAQIAQRWREKRMSPSDETEVGRELAGFKRAGGRAVREGLGCWNITLRETGISRDFLVETLSHSLGQVFQDATWLMGIEHPKCSRGPVRC